jgi:hypothetical protein
MAHNEENLHTLISTDLEYLSAWSYRCFVKFNPNKTDIMLKEENVGRFIMVRSKEFHA